MRLIPRLFAKTKILPIPSLCDVTFRVPAGANTEILAQGDDSNKWLPIAHYIANNGKFSETLKLDGFNSLKVVSANGTQCDVVIRERQKGEPIDDNPVPPKPRASNVLQQIRQKAREEMSLHREAFLENQTGLAGYELPDDEPDRFEDDAFDALEKAQKATRQIPVDDDPDPEPAPAPAPKPDPDEQD